MKQLKLTLFFVIVILGIFHLAKGQEEENGEAGGDGESESNGNSTSSALQCYTCDSTDDCTGKQNETYSSSVECDEGQHCWTRKFEENGNITYTRGCDIACKEDDLEVSCMKANNRTECSLCCSDNFCNNDEVNSAISRLFVSATWGGVVLSFTAAVFLSL